MNRLPTLKRANAKYWQGITPLLCSGASTAYAMVRARQLSRAEASDDPLLHFVLHHSDVVAALCGSTALWYVVARRKAASNGMESMPTVVDPALVRQLRQVLSALLLGIGLLERRIERGAYTHVSALAKRLHAVVRHGAVVLEQIEASPTVVAVSTPRVEPETPAG